MRNPILAFAAFAAAFVPGSAPATPPIMPPSPMGPPRLLVVISVDQFSADLFDEYRGTFSGGLALLSRGTVFRNGFQAHAATETCPGHSTILTGTHPARNGIVANNWVDQSLARANRTVYCAEDERLAVPNQAARAGTAGSYVVSPVHLRSQTLGDVLKLRSPASLNVAVGGKDRSAVMMSGHRADQRWYWEGRQFASDLRAARVPPTVARANAAIAATVAQPREPLVPPPVCQAKAAPIAITPTLTVGNGRFARAAGDSRAYRASPELDAATLAVAAGLVDDLRLGADAAPDILSIALAATDYVGHSYGPGGQEMCLQLLSVDRDLGDFFRQLDSKRLDYAVVLTADHGEPDIPERLRLKGVAGAARVDPALDTALVGKRLGTALAIAGPVLIDSGSGDIYIDRSLKPADRARVEAAALALYRAHPQVEAIFTARQLRRMRVPSGRPDRWTVAQRVRASFDPARSGDLYVVLKRHVMPIAAPGPGYVATHGSVWDEDRRVPILFWRKGMAPATRNDPVATVDILPTLRAMLGLSSDPRLDGRCLAGIPGIVCNRR